MKTDIKKVAKGRIKNSGTGDVPFLSGFAESIVNESNELKRIDNDEKCLIFGKDSELISHYIDKKLSGGASPDQIEKNLTVLKRHIDARKVDKEIKKHHNLLRPGKVKQITMSSNEDMFESLMELTDV